MTPSMAPDIDIDDTATAECVVGSRMTKRSPLSAATGADSRICAHAVSPGGSFVAVEQQQLAFHLRRSGVNLTGEVVPDRTSRVTHCPQPHIDGHAVSSHPPARPPSSFQLVHG
jgi:hypothetical protein